MEPRSPLCPRVSVVLPTFNRRDELLNALRSILDQAYPAEAIEIIVVDNSSTDGTQEAVTELATQRGRSIGYRRKEPRGPVPARNLGAELATGEWLLFVDSDVTLASDWISNAVATAGNDDSIAAVGGQVVYASYPDRLNCFGGEISRIGLCWDSLEGAPVTAAVRSADVLWINTSALLVRRASFHAVGGLDETFFYGYEEPDFGWRLTLAGWRVVVSPQLAARHHVADVVGRSDPRIVFHYCKNRLRMVLKNAGARLLVGMLAGYLAYSIADLILRGARVAKARALLWNLRVLPETLRMRRAVQALRKVEDPRIASMLAPRWFPARPLAGQRRRAADPNVTSTAHAFEAIRDDRVH